MNQLKDTLEKCNSSINNVIKTTIYITVNFLFLPKFILRI